MNELLSRRCVIVDKDVTAGEAKSKLQAEIEQKTAEFLARGGKIYTAKPSEFIVHKSGPSTTLNRDREIIRAEVISSLPSYLVALKNESGCVGVVRERSGWAARWKGKHLGNFDNYPEAVKAVLKHIKSIGYKHPSDIAK